MRGLPAWGRDGLPRLGASATWPGPRGRPRLHPRAPDRSANWWARSCGKCPLLRVRAGPAPPPPGPLNDASQDPPFSEGGRHPRPPRPPRRAPSRRGPIRGRHPRVPAGVHRAFGGARQTQRPAGEGGGVPGAGAGGVATFSAPARGGEEARAAGPAPAPAPYLLGSCRAGRRESARIPGLVALPLSPYPSIQLGLLALASPWKKGSEEKKRKIGHTAENGQPRSAGGSSEPGGSVPLGRGRPARPLPARPALAIHHRVPSNTGAALPPPRPRRPPPRARVSAPPAGGGGSWAGTWAAPLRRGPRGPREPRDAGRPAAPRVERTEYPGPGSPAEGKGGSPPLPP